MKAPYRFVSQGSKFAQLKQGVPTGKTYSSYEAARTETLRLNDAWRAGHGGRKNPDNERARLESQLESYKANLAAIRYYLGPQAWQAGHKLSEADVESLYEQKAYFENAIKVVEAKLRR